MTAESVACGATHRCTPSSLAELVSCGVLALAATVVIQALLAREGELESCRAA